MRCSNDEFGSDSTSSDFKKNGAGSGEGGFWGSLTNPPTPLRRRTQDNHMYTN